MQRNIDEIIKKFNTNPILFMGSGITRRYLNLPNWGGLLDIFIKKLNDDEYAFSAYLNKAKQEIKNDNMLYPKIAELIEKDFNEKWFKDIGLRSSLNENFSNEIRQGCSPFKVEIAQYINENAILNHQYDDEIESLRRVSKRNIASIITTNYDTFFEDNIEEYKTFIGQDELIFSNILGIGEIYKIHGSVTRPETIVINEDDYKKFDAKGQYLASKLLTLFMEYPIIFMGYSISDINIQKILNNIVMCMPDEKLSELKNRFIFIEYDTNISDYEITEHTIKIDNKILEMTKIKMCNFNILYNAIGKRKRTIPVKILRNFKEQLSEFVITNTPNEKIKVSMLNNEKIKDEDLAIAIGKASDFGIKGLNGITANEWYRSIILDDLVKYDNDDLLECGERLQRQNSGFIPLNMYLSRDKERKHKMLAEKSLSNNWDKIISKSIREKGKCVEKYNSVFELWNDFKTDLAKATRLIPFLGKDKIELDEIESVLQELFINKNILDSDEKDLRTNIRRLIKIYDYLKYYKLVKELFN